jgi:serine/threonine protein kinase
MLYLAPLKYTGAFRSLYKPSATRMVHIEGFQLLGEVSRTPFSTVYKAKKIKDKSFAYIRFFPERPRSNEPYTRWHNQASIQAFILVLLPNVEELLEVGQTDQGYYHIFRFFQGSSLYEVLKWPRFR